jgi:hypothetical protein
MPMTKQGQIIVDVKNAAKNKYAWPGGYPLCVVMSDGEVICTTCAKDNLSTIAHSTAHHLRGDWQAIGVEVNWEDTSLYCAHCNNRIESAYGED